MPHPQYDALIIGGGPGGSTAAALLAKAGLRTLVLERERFPRFHIGESLLPYNRRLFEELGVLESLKAAGFPTKLGAQFHLGNSSKALKLVFRNGRFTRETTAFQVERAKFDHLLLQNAEQAGAEVRQETAVADFEVRPDCVTIRAARSGQPPETFSGKFLIDASGRGNFTGNKENLRVVHPHLKKLAVFGHFTGVKLDDGPPRGDTVIVRLENKWFWLIPVSPQKTSVGCVMDQAEFASIKATPEEIFFQQVNSGSEMRQRMSAAQLTSKIQATSDFSYYNRRLAGARLLRVGDAAGFMDPIFSAGVYLAMHSAKLAAEVVQESIAAGDDGTRRLKVYEARVFRAMQFYWEMVEAFYTKPFMELFMEPRPRFNLPDAITAILAGELEGGWAMDWRRKLFFGLVRLQGKWPLVPRLDYSEQSAPVSAEPVTSPPAP